VTGSSSSRWAVLRWKERRIVTLWTLSVLVRLFTAFSHVLKPDVKDAFVQACRVPNFTTKTQYHNISFAQAAEDSGQLHVQASCCAWSAYRCSVTPWDDIVCRVDM
jgi:hypothetical protein